MKTHTIETVMFKLNAGTTNADFIKAADAITTYAKEQPGFVSRRLSVSEDGLWIEHIEWETLGNAQAAAAGFGKEPSLGPVMSMINGETVRMHHSSLTVSVN